MSSAGQCPSRVTEQRLRCSPSDNARTLSDEEIQQFLDGLQQHDGLIDLDDVERKLDQAHDDLVPTFSAPFRSLHSSKMTLSNDEERDPDNDDGSKAATEARHLFLRRIMDGDNEKNNGNRMTMSRDELAKLVGDWRIPSLKQVKRQEEADKGYFKRLPRWRKMRAYWAVHGPEIGFVGLIIAIQLAFGIWQLLKYLMMPDYLEGFGWGLVLAKACAGALYPTFFFLLLSMSRYFSTALRRSYYISRFLNWDLSRGFHVRISICAIVLSTLHAIGHLAGSFRYGSDPRNQANVAKVLGRGAVPMHYIDYIHSRAGYTGIIAICLMYLLCLLSIPPVRRWNYEVFQLGHLLIFPILGLMFAHGTAGLFQWPMFGYFLAFPTLLILIERFIRVVLSFFLLSATLQVLDGETVRITTIIPQDRIWKYKAGQYILLQIPQISYFQWHPFTVSFCRGSEMRVHIKTDGDWTGRVRSLAEGRVERQIKVGISGPFGAPAQRFSDFKHSVFVGAGIGVTPFSGIIADLQYNHDLDHGGLRCVSQHVYRPEHITSDLVRKARQPQAARVDTIADDYRRVDFHWTVRDRNYLLWLADLLNEVSVSQAWHREHDDQLHLDIRIATYVTAARKQPQNRTGIATHVFRWLLEMNRTDKHPTSPLTGLLNPTHFGRPDFDTILDEHYHEMTDYRASSRRRPSRVATPSLASGGGDRHGSTAPSEREGSRDGAMKVGVFYCGSPVVGEILADKCAELTQRGREDGSKVEYHFMMEVFG